MEGQAKITTIQERLQAMLHKLDQDPQPPAGLKPEAVFTKTDRQVVRRVRRWMEPSIRSSLTVTSSAVSTSRGMTAASLLTGRGG